MKLVVLKKLVPLLLLAGPPLIWLLLSTSLNIASYDVIKWTTTSTRTSSEGTTPSNVTVRDVNDEVLDEILNLSLINYSVPIFKHIPSKAAFKTNPGQCSSCALVLNSGYLLKVKAGASIDSHDCVFRFNTAPVKGYEHIVGSRTTVRLVAHSNKFKTLLSLLLQESPQIPQSVLFFYPENREKYITEIATNISIILSNTSIGVYLGERDNVAYFQRYFVAQTGRSLGPEHVWMTTGFVGVVIGLRTCDSITIFGAVRKRHCDSGLVSKRVPYNYYLPQAEKLCSFMKAKPYGHSFFEEHKIYEEWGKKRKIATLFPRN